MHKLLKGLVAVFAFAFVAAGARAATTITGAGSTFAYPLYAKWAEAYQAKTGIGLNYQSIGSGGGIKQISAGTVDFGASDAPLSVDKLKELGLVQFPTAVGGVVPVYNLPGIKPGEIHLDGPVLADIYLGKVKKWNDDEIAKLNPGVKLPSTRITTVERSDGSGTTYIFTNYLSQVSAEWSKRVGYSTAVSWPTGVGGKGNEGVAAYVRQIRGALGYVEYAYALQNHMSYVLMKNAAGRYVQPDFNSFQAAAGSADWAHAPGFNLMITNQRGAGTWPISGATFVLMRRLQQKPEVGREVLEFFDWAYHNGDALAKSLDYVPMPQNVVEVVERSWQGIKGPNGQPVWTGGRAQK